MVIEQQFREDIQRILDALNTQEWDSLDQVVNELFVADYVWHLPGIRATVRGPDGFKQAVRNRVESNPGLRTTIEDILVMGDKAATRLVTHRTDPATGKAQHNTILMISHLQDGKFAEDWQLFSQWEDNE